MAKNMNKNRFRQLNKITRIPPDGPIIYWMHRDQRLEDNWAVVYGLELARKYNRSFGIVFSLRSDLIKHKGTLRMLDFMCSGLEFVEKKATSLGIATFFLVGNPAKTIPPFLNHQKAAILITDFSPLKTTLRWQRIILNHIQIPFYEVDSHNIIPAWKISNKQEYAAYTFRPKVKRLIHKYLEPLPAITPAPVPWKDTTSPLNKMKKMITVDTTILPISVKPGYKHAVSQLKAFLLHRLDSYAQYRNDPNVNCQSDLSPYLHFGQISSHRIILQLLTYLDKQLIFDGVLIKSNYGLGINGDAFLEELVVRKELADNFCLYNHNYNSFSGFPDWAQETLNKHRQDKRDYIYSLEAFENSQTHDQVWNAAQTQLVNQGKMHGYLRMYWCKKILEWSKSPESAHETAIYLNDLYSIDGRDPNGYAGIAWSIGGVHDRGWAERPIFGKIRYMNQAGLKRKFDINRYTHSVNNQKKRL